jgi:hypothetical protein
MSAGVRRRRLAAIAGAAVAAVAIAVPGNAIAFDHHFSVISKDQGGHRTGDGFAFRIALFNTHNDRNQIGHGHGRCALNRRNHKARCKVVVHLDGSVGGFGDLFLKGNLGRGDKTLNVVDGDGDFGGGVSGKVRVDSISNRLDLVGFDLVG